jgi:hypothetical protein
MEITTDQPAALPLAGVEPYFEEWSGPSPAAYMLSLNLRLRPLAEGGGPRSPARRRRASRRGEGGPVGDDRQRG